MSPLYLHRDPFFYSPLLHMQFPYFMFFSSGSANLEGSTVRMTKKKGWKDKEEEGMTALVLKLNIAVLRPYIFKHR